MHSVSLAVAGVHQIFFERYNDIDLVVRNHDSPLFIGKKFCNAVCMLEECRAFLRSQHRENSLL